MTIKLLTVGAIKEAELRKLIDMYLQRIRHYTPLECQEIKAEKRGKTEADPQVKRREAEKLRQRLTPHETVIALAEQGRQYTSGEFAAMLGQYQLRGEVKTLTFVIGGATGLDDEFVRSAARVWSLSKMTFPHQLCRLIMLEQLYRAYTILAGEPYHKE